METIISTTDLGVGAWLASHGLRVIRATRDRLTGQVTFEFADDGRGTALVGEYTLNDVVQRYSIWRGRLAGTIRRLRDSDTDEFPIAPLTSSS